MRCSYKSDCRVYNAHKELCYKTISPSSRKILGRCPIIEEYKRLERLAIEETRNYRIEEVRII
jgi:hypothetical protein